MSEKKTSYPGTGPKTEATIAREVKNGLWGNTLEEIENRLSKEGYHAKQIMKRANSMFGMEQEPFVAYDVILTASALHVRNGPGINYLIVTTLFDDTNVYTITEVKEGLIGDKKVDLWGRLMSDLGWIDLRFTNKV